MKDFETHTFLKLLDDREIGYHYEGKWLVVDGDSHGRVYLPYNKLTSLPDYIKFNNYDFVSLSGNKLTSLPDHMEFNNVREIELYGNPLESLPDNIEEWFDKLAGSSKRYIQNNFPDHWVVNKERFNL